MKKAGIRGFSLLFLLRLSAEITGPKHSRVTPLAVQEVAVSIDPLSCGMVRETVHYDARSLQAGCFWLSDGRCHTSRNLM